MIIRKLGLIFMAMVLPFALMSCGDDTVSVDIDDENDDEPVELFYAISFSVDDGVATFTVDMSEVSGFDPETHSVFITGSLLGWTEPGSAPERQEMVLIEDDNTEIPVVEPDATGPIEYKYFSDFVGDGWEGGEWPGDPNRSATLEAGANIADEWGDQPE
jgi:hypothetical protein